MNALTKYSNMEDLVGAYVSFTRGRSSQGWNIVYCEVCGDGSRTKGPRGGWLFQGEMAFYHCFNCGVEGSYDPNREHAMSKQMPDILISFGVPPKEFQLLNIRQKQEYKGQTGKPEIRRTPIADMEVPSHFYLLSEAEDDIIADNARKYLISRNISPDSYKFYLSTGKADGGATPREKELAKDLKNRLIIPAFRGDKMIYYQARDLTGKAKKKYVNPDAPRSNIIFGYDKLYEHIKVPLFVCEGFFDSHHLNGVAVLENNLTSQQLEILQRSPRRKVIVPDYKDDTGMLAELGVNAGFGISAPDFGSDVDDIDDAVKKYGRLYVAKAVVDGIKYGAAAKATVQVLKTRIRKKNWKKHVSE